MLDRRRSAWTDAVRARTEPAADGRVPPDRLFVCAVLVAGLLIGALPVLSGLGARPVSAAPVETAQAVGIDLTAQDQRDLRRIERYMSNVDTLKARFAQFSEQGGTASGTFYMDRPGKMRLEYDPPIEDFFVADGWFLFYWDGELKQQSQTPIGSTLADFILRPNLSFSGDVTVTGIDRRPGFLEVSLVETEDPGAGALTLVFQDRPLRLNQWRVRDAQGVMTRVALLDAQGGIDLDEDLFYFVKPDDGRRRHDR